MENEKNNPRGKHSKCSPRKAVHALRRYLLDSKEENQKLAAENAALREQIATKELSWEQERKKLLDETDSSVSTLFMTRNDLDNLVKASDGAKAREKEFDQKLNKCSPLDSKAENQKLAAENAALREQIATKELSWEQERKKLLDKTDSLVSTLYMARNDMVNLVKALEGAKAREKEFDQKLKKHSLLDSKAENQKLAAENAALREQIATKELSWEQERKKLLDETDSLVSTLFMTRNDLDNLVKASEGAKAREKEFDQRLKKKEEDFRSAQSRMFFFKKHNDELEKSLKEEHAKVNKMQFSFDQTFHMKWESEWYVREEKIAAKLKTQHQQDCDKKLSQVIQEKDEVITRAHTEMMALVEENLAKMITIDTEIQQSKKEWQSKHEALEDRLRCEQEAKEESFKLQKELQQQNKEIEEKWLATKEEWLANEEKWHNTVEEWHAKEEEWLAKEEKWHSMEEKWHGTEVEWLATNEEWLAKEVEWHVKDVKWSAEEMGWIMKEDQWFSQENEWHAKEKDWLAMKEEWHAKEKEGLAMKEEWHAKEKEWLAMKEEWHAKEKEGLAIEEEWHAKEKEWLAMKEEWHAKEREWLAKEKQWHSKEDEWIVTKDEWHAKEREWLAKEEQWHSKEDEWIVTKDECLTKSSKMEEEIRLLNEQNVNLQELALKTDKEKAKMKTEEKKAEKQAEKMLKEERKKTEAREKKEKEENEKKEKERVKREKKENEEREKKEKKEREEREEREERRNILSLILNPYPYLYPYPFP